MNASHRGRYLALLCLLPFAVFFIIFQVAPLAWVALNSLQSESGWGLANFSKIFASKFYLQALQRSLEISFWSSLFGIVIATLGAYSLRRVDSKLRDFVSAFANMTSNFAGVPLAFAFIILLGFNGALTLLLKQMGLLGDFSIYSKTGLILVYTYFQIPWAYCCSTPPLTPCAKTGANLPRCWAPATGSSGGTLVCRYSPRHCWAPSSSCWPTPWAPTPPSMP